MRWCREKIESKMPIKQKLKPPRKRLAILSFPNSPLSEGIRRLKSDASAIKKLVELSSRALIYVIVAEPRTMAHTKLGLNLNTENLS